MAKIDMKKFKRAISEKKGKLVKVGNNREVVALPDGKSLNCFLHGHLIACFAKKADGRSGIMLNPCGHRGPTTRAAMNDFVEAMGWPCSVSFAEGVFSARIAGTDYNESPDGCIYVTIGGNPW